MLDRAAVDLEQARRAGDVGEALRARDGDVEAVAGQQEVEPARDVLAARATPSSRRRPAPRGPGTCRRCRPRRRPGAARAGAAPGRCTARRPSRRSCASGALAVAVGERLAERAARSRRRSRRPPPPSRRGCPRGRPRASGRRRRPRSSARRTRGSSRAGPRRTPPRRTGRRRDASAASARGRCRSSSGIVSCSPSRCSSTRAPEPSRVDALRDLGELERVAEQDEPLRRGAAGERVGEARYWPASSIDERVELPVELLAREEPGGAGDERDLRVERRRRSSRSCLMCVARTQWSPRLMPLKSRPSSAAARLDLVEQVVDHLVALRGDADLASLRDQVRDQPRAR